MVRVEHPNGVVANVPVEKADRLVAEGWKKSSATKASTGKAAPKSTSKSKSEDEK